jgi:uncharacterized cupin superfamily protein
MIINPDDLEFIKDSSALESYDLLTLLPRLSKTADAKHLAFDIRKLESGKYSFPYHFHHNAEELIMIISGSMTIRTPKGLKIANNGQLVFFEIGESGTHQFYNHDSIPCVYLDIKTTVGIDVCEYPDSGKINISPFNETYEKESQVDYNKGENNVQLIWDKLK